MSNVIQDYAWGSVTSIQTLFGIDNLQQKPQAEIWMGAHPNGCSHVDVAGEHQRLDDFINVNPTEALGQAAYERYGELPYLFKVLAAEKALSIQVHPSKAQAESGFAKEEQIGIDISSASRNYKDPNHKPELVYALTPYQAMNGFRDFAEILANFKALNIAQLDDLLAKFELSLNAKGLEHFFVSLLKLKGDVKEAALEQLSAFAETKRGDETFELILELKEQYPGDIGLFSPLFLHVLTLSPGQAMFLDACTPHAYIKGTGLEIMANSDNVLRAGLTPKHMDIEELASCTTFKPKARDLLLTQPTQAEGVEHFAVPVADFKFSVYRDQQQEYMAVTGPEILFALEAPLTVQHVDGDQLTIEKGQSLFISAKTKQYQVSCRGKFARAYC